MKEHILERLILARTAVDMWIKDEKAEKTEATGSQSNVSWRLSNHVLEFYGTGEFCIDDMIYCIAANFSLPIYYCRDLWLT